MHCGAQLVQLTTNNNKCKWGCRYRAQKAQQLVKVRVQCRCLSAVGAAKVAAWGAGDATTFLGSATLLFLLLLSLLLLLPLCSSYSVLMFPIVSFFSVGFILSSFFSFHLLLRRTFSSTFCNEELVSVMDIYLQQKLAERDDKYEYTYLEARVNWTILPTHSFLQLIAVITRIPDYHHRAAH